MSVQKMKMVSMIGEYGKLNSTIAACLQSGCFQPEQTSEVMDHVSGFTTINEENPYAALLHRVEELFELSGVVPEVVPMSQTQMDFEAISKQLDELEEKLKTGHERSVELQKKLELARTDITQLAHFDGMDINLRDAFDSEFVRVRFGRIPVEGYEKMSAYKDNPYVLFFPCSNDDSYYWGMYLAPIDETREVDRIFASLFFERLRIPEATGTPHEAIAYLQGKIEEYEQELQALDAQVEDYFVHHREQSMQTYTAVKTEFEAFELRRYACRYKDSFMLVGWIPAKDQAAFQKCVKTVDGIEVEITNPKKSGRFHPPTRLKNLAIFRPFEYYVEMYGTPNYNEMDPTVFVALTYCLIFGIMFADVGQGIVLAIAGFLMYKLKGMAIGKILVPCGISGALGGLVFGSVFGYEHLLDPMYKAIGFAEKPIDVMESSTALLAFSIGLGVALMILAMALNVYSNFKQGRPGEALFGHNGVAGIVFFVSILALVLSIALGIQLPTAPIVVFGCVLPIILIFLKGILSNLLAGKKHFLPESWGDYIIENGFELFEVVLSYITNTLSFLRVGAFVLVHAVMMMVFFSLAEMTGGGVGYVVLVIFGNVFVTVLEALLVSIQVLRLEFYEMFSRCYTGEGRPFEPIAIKA